MKASIGQIVHYVTRGSADAVYPPLHVPLLITQIFDERGQQIAGWTFSGGGLRYEGIVGYDESAAIGTWHWPERVD